MAVIRFALDCGECSGRGFVNPRRGDDWAEACPCAGRRSISQYTLARVLKIDPKSIVRVWLGTAGPSVCERVLDGLTRHKALRIAGVRSNERKNRSGAHHHSRTKSHQTSTESRG